MTDVSLRATPLRPEQFPPVVDLDDELAREPNVAGAKAAALATRRAARPVRAPRVRRDDRRAPRALAAGTAARDHAVALHAAWQALSDAGRRAARRAVVVDGRGRWLAVDGRDVHVACSTSAGGRRSSPRSTRSSGPVVTPRSPCSCSRSSSRPGAACCSAPIPVTGRTDRLVVAAVPGGPDRLVSGQVDGVQLTLSARGRLRDGGDDVPGRAAGPAHPPRARPARPHGRGDVRRPAGHRVGDRRRRPLRAAAEPADHGVGDEARAVGPVLGPGPVAETFGLPLRPLEDDLWVAPLRDGLREALRDHRRHVAPGAAASRPSSSPSAAASPPTSTCSGSPRRRQSLWSRLDPRPPPAGSKAAWRVGRLQGRAAGARRRPDRRRRRRPRGRCPPSPRSRRRSSCGCCAAPTRR